MKTIIKLWAVGAISLSLFISAAILMAQNNVVTIRKITEGIEGYAYENEPSHHYYGCSECEPRFEYETNESFLRLGDERIDIDPDINDRLEFGLPSMEFYWGETNNSKYLLFHSRIHGCSGQNCWQWYYYVVPLQKSPQDECRTVSLCQLLPYDILKKALFSKVTDDIIKVNAFHEAIFKDMIVRWEKDHRCFED